MILEIVNPAIGQYGAFQEEYYYKILCPYGSGMNDVPDDIPWSKAFIERDFEEVK